MKRIELLPQALTDIKNILLLDDLSGKRILAVLEQAKRDKTFFAKFRKHGHRDVIDDRLDVKQWKRMQVMGRDVWRIRLPDLETNGKTFRVVYAFKKPPETIYILAIVRREDIDYDNPDHPFSRRILDALASLSLPAD